MQITATVACYKREPPSGDWLTIDGPDELNHLGNLISLWAEHDETGRIFFVIRKDDDSGRLLVGNAEYHLHNYGYCRAEEVCPMAWEEITPDLESPKGLIDMVYKWLWWYEGLTHGKNIMRDVKTREDWKARQKTFGCGKEYEAILRRFAEKIFPLPRDAWHTPLLIEYISRLDSLRRLGSIGRDQLQFHVRGISQLSDDKERHGFLCRLGLCQIAWLARHGKDAGTRGFLRIEEGMLSDDGIDDTYSNTGYIPTIFRPSQSQYMQLRVREPNNGNPSMVRGINIPSLVSYPDVPNMSALLDLAEIFDPATGTFTRLGRDL